MFKSNYYLTISLAIIILFISGCSDSKYRTTDKPATRTEGKQQAQISPEKMFDYRRIELDNGLDVITLEDFSCPVVAVQIWYHVGSRNEDPNRQGFAHMFEHMMFRGTDILGPTDHFGYIRKVGGSTNGYTSFDRTVYLETLPAEQLDLVLWLEAERMAFLKIDQDAFDTERKVVEEERRMGLNRPYGSIYEKLFAELYKVHPYRWTPIGNIPHLRASHVQELRDFWQKYYVPDNATLIITGAVSHKDAQNAAKKYFGWIPRYPDPQRVDIKEPETKEEREVTLKEDNAPAPGVGIIYRTVPLKHKDAVVFDVMAGIIGGGRSSRLYRELVAEKQMAVGAEAESWSLEQDGLFGAGAFMAPIGYDLDAVLEVIEKHIEKLRNEPVGDKELIKAKNQLMRGIVTQNLTIESKARMLGQAAVDMGDVSRVNTYLEEIRSVTKDDILRGANEYLKPQRALKLKVERNLLGSLLSSAREDDAPITAERETQAPPPGKPGLSRPDDFPTKPPFADNVTSNVLPNYDEVILDNGMKVLIVSNHEVPFITVRLGFLSGAWTEEKPGTCSMAMSMLTKGTQNYTEGQLAEELETYAIGLSGSGSMDTSAVSTGALTEHIERAMKLLGEVTLKPTFPDDEFEKLRKQVLTGLEVSSATPDYIADREFRNRLYGSHPYSRTATGEIEDVNALNTEDMKNWYSRYIRPENAVLIFAGDVKKEKAVAFAKSTFGDWKPKKTVPKPQLPKIKPPDKTHIYLVDMPSATQSKIRAGHLGITRRDDRYFTSRVVSNYFGWSFNSRLNESIRVKKGLTYGASGGFSANRFSGDFRISTFTRTESTAEAVQAVIEEIKRLKSEPPDDKELNESRSYILGSFVRGRETPQQVAGDLWLIESQQLGRDYLQRLLEGVAQTERKDCVELAESTVDEDSLVIVVVGQAQKLGEQLEKIAPVTVISREKT
ncbi:MAG: insulinase family protein [Sedimentisphaerales bacterium]|nr:insulinase family protein [Sedimentisphaerales bacterium]